LDSVVSIFPRSLSATAQRRLVRRRRRERELDALAVGLRLGGGRVVAAELAQDGGEV